jgi:hypothetical protein
MHAWNFDLSAEWYINEVVNLTDTKLKELVDNQNGAGLTFHNWVDSDRRYGIFLPGSF